MAEVIKKAQEKLLSTEAPLENPVLKALVTSLEDEVTMRHVKKGHQRHSRS